MWIFNPPLVSPAFIGRHPDIFVSHVLPELLTVQVCISISYLMPSPVSIAIQVFIIPDCLN